MIQQATTMFGLEYLCHKEIYYRTRDWDKRAHHGHLPQRYYAAITTRRLLNRYWLAHSVRGCAFAIARLWLALAEGHVLHCRVSSLPAGGHGCVLDVHVQRLPAACERDKEIGFTLRG